MGRFSVVHLADISSIVILRPNHEYPHTCEQGTVGERRLYSDTSTIPETSPQFPPRSCALMLPFERMGVDDEVFTFL
jgi:hypothetical protein